MLLFRMRTVVWPSAVSKKAEVWRVLDLSGLTNSVRQSRNYIKSNYVYVNGNLVNTLKAQVDLGIPFHLEIRFPNGVIHQDTIYLIQPTYYKPRLNQPDTRYHKP